MENYEPTAARRREIIQAKLRGLYEQRYSLELDVRVNARIGDAETVAAIKKDLAKIEGAIDLYMADLDGVHEQLPAGNGLAPLELIK